MRLRWQRGRLSDLPDFDGPRAVEWMGMDDAGNPVARVVRICGPVWNGWRLYRAVALDDEAHIVELRPAAPPDGRDWLALVGGRVVARGAVALEAVRAAERALVSA